MTRIVFIVGMARSGSTMLTALLDRAEGFAGLGEAHVYWEIAGSDRKCGCGRRLDACPVWGGLRRAQGEEGIDVVAARDAFRAYLRPRPGSLLRRLGARRRGDGAAALDRYSRDMEHAYRWLAGRMGADVLVDSSKLPAAADLTAAETGMDVRLVHLVRDPRAVAHSLARRTEAGGGGGSRLLYLVAALRAALDWTLRNAYVEARLRRGHGGRCTTVRFEDLTASPRATLRGLLAFAGADPADDGFAGERTVELGENHILTGDDSRFRRGEIVVAPQDTWQTAMPAHARLATTLIALPLLRRYRYPLLTRRRRAAPPAP